MHVHPKYFKKHQLALQSSSITAFVTLDIYTSNTLTTTTTTTMSNPFQIPVKTVRTRVPIILQGGSHRQSVVLEVESAPYDIPTHPPPTTTTTMSNSFQIPVQTVQARVPIIVQGDSHRHSVVLQVESGPCDLNAEPERDTRRDTIGRDDFLQLRLPAIGLLDADEINGILDVARGDSDVAVDQTPVVHNPVITSPAASQQTNTPTVPTVPTVIAPANSLQRRPRTSRSTARSIAPALSMVSEEEGTEAESTEEEDENEAGVKPARKLTWRRGFRGIFRRGSGRI